MKQTKTEKIIQDLKPYLVERISEKLALIKEGTKDVTIAWKKMQDVAADEMVKILKEKLPQSNITSPQTKSTYPDVKIENAEGKFAIDIKTNEDSKNPWFDMARIDTMMKDRIEKYVEEWEFVIRFDSNTGKFIKAYFTLFREAVGIREECNGIKYRPYDGKVRPKSWVDFDNEKIYWDSKEKFLEGIEKSLKHRWIENIKQHFIPKLSREERLEIRKLFDDLEKIDDVINDLGDSK